MPCHRKKLSWAWGLVLVVSILSVRIVASGNSDNDQGYALDYPKYIGGTLGALLDDIGYTPKTRIVSSIDDSTKEITYSPCWLWYPKGVEIYVAFSPEITEPLGQEGKINDINYFRNDTIGFLEVNIFCHSKDEK